MKEEESRQQASEWLECLRGSTGQTQSCELGLYTAQSHQIPVSVTPTCYLVNALSSLAHTACTLLVVQPSIRFITTLHLSSLLVSESAAAAMHFKDHS